MWWSVDRVRVPLAVDTQHTVAQSTHPGRHHEAAPVEHVHAVRYQHLVSRHSERGEPAAVPRVDDGSAVARSEMDEVVHHPCATSAAISLRSAASRSNSPITRPRASTTTRSATDTACCRLCMMTMTA